MREAQTDPQAGRGAVLLAGLLGATAIVAYAATAVPPRAEIAAPTERSQAAMSLADLAARAATARETLDLDQLARVANELDRFVRDTTLATKANAAKLELVEISAAAALEAAIRANHDDDGREAALDAVAKTTARARTLAEEIEGKGIDQARLDAALARVELAAGTDITQAHPVVLMPTFRDPELRMAATSAPLWREQAAPPSAALVEEVLAGLRACERQTALVRLLTAQAMAMAGQKAAARELVEDVLEETPRQPLARALLRGLGPAPVVAVAGDPKSPTPTPSDPPPAPVDPPPAVEATPTPKPEVAKPTPKPETAKPTPKPETAKPESGEKKPGYDALLDEGCKLVRSGRAEEGFDVLKRAFDLNPNAVAVTVCMAEAHHALGRDASARALCDRALRKSPSDRRALLLAAALELARGNEAAALGHYRKVLEKHPDDAKAKAYVDAHGG